MIGRVLALAALLSSAAEAASGREPLQPVDPWVLDYAAADCIASRDYGSASSPIALALVPSPNLETYELVVLRDRSGPWFANELEGSVDFGRGPVKAWLLHYGQSNKGSRNKDIERFRISAADMEAARAASSVTFTADGEDRATFALDHMPELLDGLKDCTENLRRYWNFGNEKSGKIATPSKADVRSVFTGSDFPAEALQRRQEGRAQFLLLIDEQGKVAACHVLKTSGVPDFDAMGCAVITERAKFKPALGPDGKPVRSSFVTPPVVWRIGW